MKNLAPVLLLNVTILRQDNHAFPICITFVRRISWSQPEPINYEWRPLKAFSIGFFYFDFKIRLIRLGLSFQKTKISVFEFATYWFTARSQLWVGDTEKLSVTFSDAWLILVEFT